MKLQFALTIVCTLAISIAGTAQEINTGTLSENGWFSDDTRADGTGTEVAGTNLISDTLTDDPEASASGSATHDADINAQISIGPAVGTVPAGTNTGAVHLQIAPAVGAGKSQISHRKDDGTGHGPGSAFGPGFTAEYHWMGDGTVSVTASLKFGIKTADFGSTGVSSRTGENVWDKVLIYEPGNLNGGTSDSLWHTETIDYTTGKWWFFDRAVGASNIGTPVTLSDMSTDLTIISGAKTVADVYALITAPGAHITSVQVGIGSGNPGGSVYVNQIETNAYRAGMTTTFGCGDIWYANDFEVDDFGWNVFGGSPFDSVRVPSGTNGVTSASGSWHCEAVSSSGPAGNWGGYSGVCGCASTACSGPVSTFPLGGYVTSIDVYLDVAGGFANNTRFDFSSAINKTDGSHRRDFIFNAGFYNDTDGSPGSGSLRYIVSASNTSQPGSAYPKNPARGPIAITASGWYTFQHRFYDSGAGILACDLVILDSSGDEVNTWTLSDVTDIIGSTVGSNRYGWFDFNEFPTLAFDNASRQPGPYDQDITPDVIFGSGNANGSWTVDRQDGVELGMRAKLRNPPMNIFNSNGDGTYTYNTGSGTASFPQSEWTMEWSANSDYDDSSGWNVGDLTYEMGMDNDPGGGTDYLVFDPISIGTIIPYIPPSPAIPYWDHAMGDNTTANGAGVSAGDGATYAGYLSTFNVAQNSWKPTFYQNTAPYAWDPDVPGFYEYYLAAFDGGTEVARTAITVIVVDGLTLSLEADTCQTDSDGSTPGVQVEFELWLRNPDATEVTGYQAFLAFNDTTMAYEGTLSSYSTSPFPFNIQPITTAEVSAGELRLDGNTFTPPGTMDDAKLATLVFTVSECTLVGVDFDLGQSFDSEASMSGVPLVTELLDSPSVTPDVTPPVLAPCPADITQATDADSGCTGAIVTWTDPTATDNCDPSPVVVCDPPSGSFFPVGTTTVTCTATDECGNESTCTFDVTITDTVLVDVTVELTGSMPVTDRCIHFEVDSCSADSDHELDFVGTAPAVAVATIEIPCGAWTVICAKDEQHTKWSNPSPMVVSGVKYTATTTLVLDGGDTDNDGDVDINDVTLFVDQFGNLAADGGCPWDGTTRDADFDNGGSVDSPDYAFLVANWLTVSTSCCTLPVANGPNWGRLQDSVRVFDDVTAAVDFNQDGRVDVHDIEIFEQRHGFSGELSRRMRASQR